MLGAGAGTFTHSKRVHRGQCTRPTEQPARALMNGGNRLLAEQLLFSPSDLQVMRQISGHVIVSVASIECAQRCGGRNQQEVLEQKFVHHEVSPLDHRQQGTK